MILYPPFYEPEKSLLFSKFGGRTHKVKPMILLSIFMNLEKAPSFPNLAESCGCSIPEIKCHIVPNFNISKVRYQKIFTVFNCIITKIIVLFQEIGWALLGIIHTTIKYCKISDILPV